MLLVVAGGCAKTETVDGAAEVALSIPIVPAAEKMLVAGAVDVLDAWAPEDEETAGVLVGKKLPDGGVDFSDARPEKMDD